MISRHFRLAVLSVLFCASAALAEDVGSVASVRGDAQIGRGHVGVSPNHEGRAPVAEKSHGLLLARRFAMDVDDDGLGLFAQRAVRELTIDGREGIVERIHEDATHGVDHQRSLAVFCLDQHSATARRAGRRVAGGESRTEGAGSGEDALRPRTPRASGPSREQGDPDEDQQDDADDQRDRRPGPAVVQRRRGVGSTGPVLRDGGVRRAVGRVELLVVAVDVAGITARAGIDGVVNLNRKN